ncbi:ras GTPase-activating protein-binding protein 1-like [Melanaphis sacchari]|uniref:ras GTPase-activating protein-binding protein 1-like n=1 Tax=Melanaphis sacchari TaxID=742174 RepID=UPI000DC13E6C|nr:ras GTPase-activating protein-binding protein 1-like [Melanaphis sacchari]
MSENDLKMDVDPSVTELCDVTTQPVREFIYRYYMTLTGVPHDTWRLYTVGARYTHVGGCGPEEARDQGPVFGQFQIHVNIMHQRFTECQFFIRSIYEQPMANGCIHVLVTGDKSRSKQPAVSFVQSFVLEFIREINQYAIANSILRVYTLSPPLPR